MYAQHTTPDQGNATPSKLRSGSAPAEPTMFYGLLGDTVKALEPYTESDPHGLMMVLLSEFGNAVGADPYFLADGARHGTRIDVLMVGNTSKGRKGTVQGNIDRIMQTADPEWWEEAKTSGLSSGEGLISAADGTKDRPKRLLVTETEFARALTVAKRGDNVLSMIIRQAYDDTHLSILTKSRVKGNGHISIIGHITLDELHKTLSFVEITNGSMNRFLFANVHRSKELPHGGGPGAQEAIDQYAPRIGEALKAAREIEEMKRSLEASKKWEELYTKWAKDDDDELSARAPANVLRLSMIFALVDRSSIIEIEHLLSANEVWEYNLKSIKSIFREGLNGHLGKLARALEKAHPNWMTGKEVSAVFSYNLKSKELDELKRQLEDMGMMERQRSQPSGKRGRPLERYHWTP